MSGRVRYSEGCISPGSDDHCGHDAYFIDGDGNLYVLGGNGQPDASVQRPEGVCSGDDHDGFTAAVAFAGGRLSAPHVPPPKLPRKEEPK